MMPSTGPTDDEPAVPTPAPVDPAPLDPAPLDPAPLDPAPLDPAPLDPGEVGRALAAVPGLGRVLVVARTASTSTDLVHGVTAGSRDWPDRSVLVADHQEAGRGRAGRTWTTPPRTALTVSVLLRPAVPLDRFGWVPLLAGLSVVRALHDVAGVTAVLKWPNDVLVKVPDDMELAGWGPYRKVAGVLGDLVVTDGSAAVVVGIGINVAQGRADLPVPSATSLAVLAGTGSGPGIVPDRTHLLGAVVGHLVALDARWRAAQGDAAAAGLARECAEVCATIGSMVQVELPGGAVLEGTARGLAGDGALEVVDHAGRTRTVLAGDVHHLRMGPPVLGGRGPGPRRGE